MGRKGKEKDGKKALDAQKFDVEALGLFSDLGVGHVGGGGGGAFWAALHQQITCLKFVANTITG